MKKIIALLVALAVAASFAASAFAGTTVDFEKKNSSSIIAFSDYGMNLTDVTIEESTEQAHSGSSSVKVTVKPDETKVDDSGKAFFTLMLLPSDTTNPVSKLTEDDVANFFYYLPEDGNIGYISMYICDEESWDYCSVGTIEPDTVDEWCDFSEEIDFIRFDEDTRTGSEGTNKMPCAIMFECYLMDAEAEAYFYLDDFYFGAEDGSDGSGEAAEPTEAPAGDNNGEGTEPTKAPESDATAAPDANATTAPSSGSGDATTWIIVGCVIAAAVVIAAVAIVISKKKK